MRYTMVIQILIIFVLVAFIIYQKVKYSNMHKELFFAYQEAYFNYKDEQVLREVEYVINMKICENKLKEKDEQIIKLKKILNASETKRKELCKRLHERGMPNVS